ncbi:MAG: class I SAM-dependent methyltransferase [Candidatus Brennerbacteria bacterium]
MDTRQGIFGTFEVPDPIRIRKVARFMRGYFPSLKGRRLLECGYAKGGLTDILRQEGVTAVCVDMNPRADMDGVHMIQRDLNNGLPSLKERFDIVFAGEVMEHLYDDEGFLRGVRELLKPDGILALTVPNLVFSVNRLRMLFGMTPAFAYARYHYHMYTAKTLRALIEEAGFEVAYLASSHFLFSTRRNPIGKVFEVAGDWLPSWGAHLIIFARPKP